MHESGTQHGSAHPAHPAFLGLRRWPSLHGVRSGVEPPGTLPEGWQGLVSISRTPEECSVIGPWTGSDGAELGPYRAWSIPGPLAPDLVGVLAAFLVPLRSAGIPVLAVSTHDTDWILIEEALAIVAEAAWSAIGVRIEDAVSTS